MIVDEGNVRSDSWLAREIVPFVVDDVAASVSDAKRGAFKPGYAFQIVGVQVLAGGVTANASVDVKVGSTSALASVVDLDATGAATRADGTLHATLANRRGDKDAEINVHVTTDGTGAIEDLQVYVLIRPQETRGA